MRFLAGLAATLFCVAPVFAAEKAEQIRSDSFEQKVEAGKTFQFAKALDAPVNLQVSNAAGIIEVSNGLGKSLQISGTYEGGDPAKLRVDSSGRTVSVSVEYPVDAGGGTGTFVSVNGKTYRYSSSGISVSIAVTNRRVFINGKDVTNDPRSSAGEVRLRVLIPNDLLLDLTSKETAGDSVVSYLANRDRKIHVESISGRAVLQESSGKRLIAESVSGEIVTEATTGGLEANSTSGSVSVSHHVGDVTASTISGSVSVSNNEGDVNAKSISGDVQVLMTRGPVDASSVSGSVRLNNPKATSEEAESISGSVRKTERPGK